MTSSSGSPFSIRCLNSAVFPARSSSERASNSGSSVPMYAACSCSRLSRRPSPTRRTFSNLPKLVVDIATRVAGRGSGLRAWIRRSDRRTLTGRSPDQHVVGGSVAPVDSSALSAPVFAQLAGERREEFAEVCEELDVEAGTTLIREGDFGYAMFAV